MASYTKPLHACGTSCWVMELSLRRMGDEMKEEERSYLGFNWVATPAGTGGTCTESQDSQPGAPAETYGCCHRSMSLFLLSRCMTEPRETLRLLRSLSRRQPHSITEQEKASLFHLASAIKEEKFLSCVNEVITNYINRFEGSFH